MRRFFLFQKSQRNIEDKEVREVSLWERIRTKIEKITPQKKPSVTTAVGGVRGTRSEAGKELYWKGEEVKPKVSEQELARFEEALIKAEEGDSDSARKLFESFVSDFPESDLKPDAFLALKEMDEVTATK